MNPHERALWQAHIRDGHHLHYEWEDTDLVQFHADHCAPCTWSPPRCTGKDSFTEGRCGLPAGHDGLHNSRYGGGGEWRAFYGDPLVSDEKRYVLDDEPYDGPVVHDRVSDEPMDPYGNPLEEMT